MKILMSGSGSGGHIYPCIALYSTLKEKNTCDVMAFRPIDKKIYSMNNINITYIDNELSSLKKYCQIYKHIKQGKYDCCLTFGGKNAFLIAIACHQLKVKVYGFEQNAVIGKANALAYLFFEKLFTSFPLSKHLKKQVHVGNPAAEIKSIHQIKLFKDNKPIVLFTMGSQGASTVNKIIEEYLSKENQFNYILITGTNVKSNLKEKSNLKIFEYYNPLHDLLASSDIIVSRAGATTMAEIIALNLPSIFIPSPFVANNHQEKNVKALLEKEACQCIFEKDLNYNKLKFCINSYALNKKNYQRAKKQLKLFQKNEIHQRIIQVLNNENT